MAYIFYRRIFAVVSLAVLLFSCGGGEKKDASKPGVKQQPPVRSDAFVVKKVTLADTIEVPGSILANEETEIHPETAGRITYLNVAEGKIVGKGTLIAKLYDGDLQASLNKLYVQLKIAQANEERSAKLLNIQGISKQDYETSLLNVNNIKADIAITKANITKTEIRAPFSGKIGLKMISTGSYVSPSSVITTISQVNQMRIDFTIPEKYTSQVRPGFGVLFTTDSYKKPYYAKVIATESNITETTRTLTVRAAVQGDMTGLVPGNFAEVKLNFEPDTNAITIPTQAVIPQARGKKVYVYANGMANFVDVTTGIRTPDFVEVTEGLKPGDTVLLTGLLSLKPGAKVMLGKIVNAPSNATTTTK